MCLEIIAALFGMSLAMLPASSTAVAAESEGFVVVPENAPKFPGPAGMESFITEVLATAEQTGGAFGIWRYVRQPGGGPGCLRYCQMFSTRFNSGARDGRKSKVMNDPQ